VGKEERKRMNKRKRVVMKGGATNVDYKNISKKRRRYFLDLYTTLLGGYYIEICRAEDPSGIKIRPELRSDFNYNFESRWHKILAQTDPVANLQNWSFQICFIELHTREMINFEIFVVEQVNAL
jgi:hypothetical protein